jgi:hypothetical protein
MSATQNLISFIGKHFGNGALKTGKEKLRKLSFFAVISCLFLSLSTNSSAQRITPGIVASSSELLIGAVKKGDLKEVGKLIDDGADVNKVSSGVTPLYWAVFKNKPEIVRYLLDKGADINKAVVYKNKPTSNPIHVAVIDGNAEIVKLLIERGADINAYNIQGKTALEIAEEKNVVDPRKRTSERSIYAPIVKLLKDAQAKQSGNLAVNNEKPAPVVVENKIVIAPSDVDIDIPVNGSMKPNAYALIIGNEDYSSFQTGLSTEVNVDYAINDARVFKEYCAKTLGIPEKQIKLLTNATYGQISQGIAWLSNLAKIDNGKAELFFYYSGHGLPDEQTRESYLMPVDISGTNITQAIKLADVYSRLNEFPSKKVSVFLDACFSGGARNQGLISMRGVRIAPKENDVTGNIVVFSSSSGEESSGAYKDKQHGYMTYFLLKKLQESKGNVSYKELADYILENVKKETALDGKNQTPQLDYSPGVEKVWSDWKIK